MRKFLLMLAAVAATGGCAAQGSQLEPIEKVETMVGLLVPATSERARELGVVAWDIRTGRPGTQVAAVTADNRRLGTIFYTLMAHRGVDASLLVMRLKLGERGQLAVANDGTVVENSLSRVPGSSNFLEAIEEDLDLLDAPGVVPYAGGAGAPCANEVRATTRSCVRAALWSVGCVVTKVPGVCGRAAAGLGQCGFNAYRTYECGKAPGSEDIEDSIDRRPDAGAGEEEPPASEPSAPNWCASYADCPSESEGESGTPSESGPPEATSDEENPWPSDAVEGEPAGTSDDDTTDFDYPEDGSSGAPESDPAEEEPTGTADDDLSDFEYPGDGSEEPADSSSAPEEGEPSGTADDDTTDFDYPADSSEESGYPPEDSSATSDDGFGDYEGYGGDDTNDDGFEDDWTTGEGGTSDATDEAWTEEDSGWEDEGSGSSGYEGGASSDDGYGDYGTSSSGDDYDDDSASGGSGGDDYYEEDSGGSAGDYYDDSASGGSGGDEGSGSGSGSDSAGGDYYDDSSSGGSGGDDGSGGGGGGDEGIWT